MKTYLKPLLLLLPVILVLGYLLVRHSKKSEFSEEDLKQAKVVAQSYETLDLGDFTDWKGNTFPVTAESAPIIIVHFWASWCGPCIHEFPDLIKMANALSKQVIVVAISEDNKVEEITAFIKSFRDASTTPNFHIVYDEDRAFMKKWSVRKLPESYIYGPDRKLAKKVSGVVSWSSADTAEFMRVLAAKAVAP